MATYYGRTRTQYVLDTRLGGGGEGEVYAVQGHRDLVAKVYRDNKLKPTNYNTNPRQQLHEKIKTMLDQPVSAYTSKGILVVAWPQDILYDSNGQFVGYTMPRVQSKYHIFAASRERERVMLYPNYTWRTAITIAYNLAMAVWSVNRTGAVVGDMNPNNIMVDSHGHVILIDTDSFNIRNEKTGKIYKCSVGVPEMLPPELQGVDLSDPANMFTEKTDGFALSIHVFNLLMNNCHPFGVTGMNKSKSSTSNAPIAKQITRGQCPYVTGGTGRTSLKAPDVAMLPIEIRELFDRAFSYDVTTALRARTIARRPSSRDWLEALRRLYTSTLVTCNKDTSHVYPAGYPTCPWCSLKTPPFSSSLPPNNPAPPPPSPPLHIQPRIRRDAWPVWVMCLVVGIAGGFAMAPLLIFGVAKGFNITLSMTFSRISLMILGVIIGGFVAKFAQERYQTAYNGWPWLLTALLVPLGIAVAASVIVLAIAILVLALAFVVVIGIICGLCEGA